MENRRLLTVRTSGKDAFYLPGGKREPGESDLDALLREVRE
ncbi:MAG TPA: NUDIX domain-containing protein [Candidatus Nitrosotalea sp.]|nr:NUDIX domain-containing protein [Candidatus Nitrosotalea sp.]